MQFRARAISYTDQYPAAQTWLIVTQQGNALGQYILSETAQVLRIVDLAILPQYRSRGVATQVLQQLQQQAAAAGLSLALRVAKESPALRLHTRLGFVVTGEDALSYQMIWR